MTPPRSVAPGLKIFLANKKRIWYFVKWRWLALAPRMNDDGRPPSRGMTVAASGSRHFDARVSRTLGRAEVHLCNQVARKRSGGYDDAHSYG